MGSSINVDLQPDAEEGQRKVYTFQPKARTVDHLGREQIADTPTAVSELWKNAYDAYARSVSLHVLDVTPSAAVLDNGSGMSQEDFINRWLVLGTESKVEEEKKMLNRSQTETVLNQEFVRDKKALAGFQLPS